MKIKTKIGFISWAYVLIFDLIAVLLGFLTVSPLASSKIDMAFAEELFGNGQPDNSLNSSAIDPVVYPYTKFFTISAYYSPLLCQQKYVTGSYEGDIRLNGGGVRGADRTPVYPGMIAAPRSYVFGTKMDIPGVGIMAVHDRGGAIVSGDNSRSYDRLDIWMGYGDKGLRRALTWGMRTMEVVVYGPNDSISEQVALADYTPDEANAAECGQVVPPSENNVPVVEKSVNVVSVANAASPLIKPDEFSDKNLKLGDSGNAVTDLQVRLSAFNFFRTDVSGYYGEVTKHAVFKFQQSQGLVGKETSPYAGIFGSKTRDRLNELVAAKNYNGVRIASATDEYERVLMAKIEADMPKKTLLTSEMGLGNVGPDVAKLQKFLKDHGFFDGALITQYYGPVTQKAVLRFQKAHNIIKSENDIAAGKVGVETLEVINTLS